MLAVKEMFLTIQGEGFHAGKAAVFVRFSGCNLWSGIEKHRGTGGSCSKWCDTDFVGTNGTNGGFYTEDELVQRANELSHGADLLVFTGGEPALQLTQSLVDQLRHQFGTVAIETNGTRAIPDVDWVCVSPKQGTDIVVRSGNELKLVFPQPFDPSLPGGFEHLFVQPMAGNPTAVEGAVKFVLTNPAWRLSLQTHKILGIP